MRWVADGEQEGGSKPVVVAQIALWDPAGQTPSKYKECGTAKSVAAFLNAAPRDRKSVSSFSMVPVRIHGSQPAGTVDVARAIALLDPGVEVVDAFEFVRRLTSLAPNVHM